MVALNSRFLLLTALAATAVNPDVVPGVQARALQVRRVSSMSESTSMHPSHSTDSMLPEITKMSKHHKGVDALSTEDGQTESSHRHHHSKDESVKTMEARDPRHRHRPQHHNHPRDSERSNLAEVHVHEDVRDHEKYRREGQEHTHNHVNNHDYSKRKVSYTYGDAGQVPLAARHYPPHEVVAPIIQVGPVEVGSLEEVNGPYYLKDHRHLHDRSPRHSRHRHSYSHGHAHVHTENRRSMSDNGGEIDAGESIDKDLGDQGNAVCGDRHEKHVSCRDSGRGSTRVKRSESEGVKGTIDIVNLGSGSSGTVAHLLIKQTNGTAVGNSTSSSNSTDDLSPPAFVLDASSTNSSQFLMFANDVSLTANNNSSNSTDEKKLVRLEVSLFDPKKAAMEAYCATYDPNPPAPAPLGLKPCYENSSTTFDHESQTFTYRPEDNVIAPRWSTPQSDSSSTTPQKSFRLISGVKAASPNSSGVDAKSVALVFNPSVETVNAMDTSGVVFEPASANSTSNSTNSMSSATSSLSTTASSTTSSNTSVSTGSTSATSTATGTNSPTSTDSMGSTSTSSDVGTSASSDSSDTASDSATATATSTASIMRADAQPSVQSSSSSSTATSGDLSPSSSTSTSSSSTDSPSSISSSTDSDSASGTTSIAETAPESSSTSSGSSAPATDSEASGTATATATVTVAQDNIERMFNSKLRYVRLGQAAS